MPLLPELLDERARLQGDIKEMQDQLKQLDAEMKDKIGDARQVLTNGWRIKQTVTEVPAKIVERKAYSINRIYVSMTNNRK